jgi:hypothetical protein
MVFGEKGQFFVKYTKCANINRKGRWFSSEFRIDYKKHGIFYEKMLYFDGNDYNF